ncbi:hypothetical protein ACJJTC_009384 [Scirpophaga incertulas]
MARRLVLNGLTAEVGVVGELGEVDDGREDGARGGEQGPSSPDSAEFYHELELYRQLLALPPRRARTPDPAPAPRHCGEHYAFAPPLVYKLTYIFVNLEILSLDEGVPQPKVLPLTIPTFVFIITVTSLLDFCGGKASVPHWLGTSMKLLRSSSEAYFDFHPSHQQM